MRELSRGGGYGYDILRRIRKFPAMEVTESSVYLILGRLAKEGLLSSTKEKSSLGPTRSLYAVTALGRVRLLHMKQFIVELQACLAPSQGKGAIENNDD
nr:PadR family transcriptional regulator [Puniceicoccus vermicola]